MSKPDFVVYWGTYSLREGWWIGCSKYSKPLAALYGPSICTASGGGPDEAVKVARKLGFEGEIKVEIPDHELSFDGRMCLCRHLNKKWEDLCDLPIISGRVATS